MKDKIPHAMGEEEETSLACSFLSFLLFLGFQTLV